MAYIARRCSSLFTASPPCSLVFRTLYYDFSHLSTIFRRIPEGVSQIVSLPFQMSMSTNVSSTSACYVSRRLPVPPMYYYPTAVVQEPVHYSPTAPVTSVFADVPSPLTLDTKLYNRTSNNPNPMPRNEVLSFLDDDEVTLSDWIDRTLLDLCFDLSCLEELDDQLLLAPLDAFAAICWADAVDKDDHTRPWPWGYSDTQQGFDFDKISDVESEETAGPLTPTQSRAEEMQKQVSFDEEPRNSVEIQTRQGRRLSFVLLTPPSAMSDPKYSIHYFPTSPRKSNIKKQSRLKRLMACLQS
ncbi:hypothetical protein NEOLEDRAFT_803549 [Neolentinus lepideus HHB14362 ss-1]|uniref:Uncharacterized protein n=1 Tax=Neolentinus lepideus HHB14362 ss-1 TaxID=1314782 RepID=A0A165PJ33_9AGAM|nr:hypothetical protein NEOLEDRAFT_803549 [Neolentinus lepideus HHB14362 ss-1]